MFPFVAVEMHTQVSSSESNQRYRAKIRLAMDQDTASQWDDQWDYDDARVEEFPTNPASIHHQEQRFPGHWSRCQASATPHSRSLHAPASALVRVLLRSHHSHYVGSRGGHKVLCTCLGCQQPRMTSQKSERIYCGRCASAPRFRREPLALGAARRITTA